MRSWCVKPFLKGSESSMLTESEHIHQANYMTQKQSA